MQAAIDIFLNGIFGVFVGLGVLYAAIKINEMAAREKPAAEDEKA